MWLRVYDPDRTPDHWLKIIQPGEYCVSILDANLRVPKDFEGRRFGEGEASVEIASGFADAVLFAESVVNRHPELCYEIYTHEGKAQEPLRTVYAPSVRGKYEGLPLAKRETMIGLSIWAAAVPFIVWDARQDLRWMWGYIVGLKLLVIGSSFLVRGAAGLCEHHFRKCPYPHPRLRLKPRF